MIELEDLNLATGEPEILLQALPKTCPESLSNLENYICIYNLRSDSRL